MTDPPPSADFDHAIAQAAAQIARARHLCISTGAGMSAESGVPTFRDAHTGLWSRFRPEELATLEAFHRNPTHVWAWYRERRRKLQQVQPHAGHEVLARWEQHLPRLTLVTQNVDGLHHRAGSRNVIELHGRLDAARCTNCSYHHEGLDDLGPDPHCPECGQRLRPGVVWFGEMLPPGALEAAFEAARTADLLLVIGTSGIVQPAASLADTARAAGAQLIEINPTDTPLSGLMNVRIRSGCRNALTAIDNQWQHRRHE